MALATSFLSGIKVAETLTVEGPDVVEAIGDPTLFEGRHLDLGEANRRQLLNAGLAEKQIEVSSLCTKCREDLFHSYRRDGKKTGHMLSVIGISS